MNTSKALLFCILYLLALQTQAQSHHSTYSNSSYEPSALEFSIQPFDTLIEFDGSLRPCIQVNVDPEPKTLKEAWRDYLKDNYDFKLKGIGFLSNKDLLSAEEITVTQISSKEMDFYTYITEDEIGSEMRVFVRYGYDVYVNKNSTPTDYEALSTIIESFLKYYLPIYYQGRVNDTEKRIEKLRSESNDLQKEIEDDSSRIAALKEEIEKLEADLKTNTERLEKANIKLIKRNEKLNRIRGQLREL